MCDINEEALSITGEKYQIPPERRYREHTGMLQNSEIDAVSICTPNFKHFSIALDAVHYGVPFALEKPIAMNKDEAFTLRNALLKSPVPHMICFTYRYMAAARYARQLIKEERLGRIYHVYSQYLQRGALNEAKPLTWRYRKELSGSGALGDLGSHVLDMHRFLVGETTSVVAHADTMIRERELPGGEGRGTVDVDDFCHVLGRMESGAASSTEITRLASGRRNYQTIEVYGSKGALVYRLEDLNDSLELMLPEEGDTDFRKADVPELYKVDQMQSFFNLIRGVGDGLDATIEDGFVNQMTLEAIIQSFEMNRWVDIATVDEERA